MKAWLEKFTYLVAKIYPLAKRWLHSFNGGVFPQYLKSLSADQPIHATIIPERLIIPLQQQVGQTAELLVKVGDKVQKNQLIARSSKDATKALVVPIHAPTSGVIEDISEQVLPHPSGLSDISIVIKTDQQDHSIQNVLQVSGELPENAKALKSILLNSGIIGMGGAGFPTYAKIPDGNDKVEMVLINGAECEPFITCDDLLMQNEAESIIEGALVTADALGAKKVLCGIESNKPKALNAMRLASEKAAEKTPHQTVVEVIEVQTVYPMGGQEQLIYELTGIEVAHDKHAVEVGLLMMNVATFASIYRAIAFGEPLTSRLVSVTGLELEKPFNIRALIGTPFSTLVNAAQPKNSISYPLVMGGPMMGFKVASNDVPVIKTTNCILANPPEPTEIQMPCIRCGECMDACPINLLPQQMYWHSQAREFDKVDKLNVFDCIECGCCSYVCPSHIPLVQYYRNAKSEIKELHAEAKAADLAKQRHEFRLARLEREKQEREARIKAKKAAVKKQIKAKDNNSDTGTTTTSKANAAASAARAAAAKRAAAKKAESSSQNSETMSDSSMPPARRKAIEAAQKAAKKATDLSQNSPKTAASEKEKARQASIKTAQAAAAKRRQQKLSEKSNAEENITEATIDETIVNNGTVNSETDKQAKKQQSMQLAKEKAQQRAKLRAQEKMREKTLEESNTEEKPE